MVFTTIFTICFIMDLISLVWTFNLLKRQICWIACAINLTSAVTYLLLYEGYFAVIYDSNGRPFLPTRVLLWLFSTPCMVFMLGELSNRWQFCSTVIAYDVVMIISGFLASFFHNWLLKWVSFSVSGICFIFTLNGVVQLFSNSTSTLLLLAVFPNLLAKYFDLSLLYAVKRLNNPKMTLCQVCTSS